MIDRKVHPEKRTICAVGHQRQGGLFAPFALEYISKALSVERERHGNSYPLFGKESRLTFLSYDGFVLIDTALIFIQSGRHVIWQVWRAYGFQPSELRLRIARKHNFRPWLRFPKNITFIEDGGVNRGWCVTRWMGLLCCIMRLTTHSIIGPS